MKINQRKMGKEKGKNFWFRKKETLVAYQHEKILNLLKDKMSFFIYQIDKD